MTDLDNSLDTFDRYLSASYIYYTLARKEPIIDIPLEEKATQGRLQA